MNLRHDLVQAGVRGVERRTDRRADQRRRLRQRLLPDRHAIAGEHGRDQHRDRLAAEYTARGGQPEWPLTPNSGLSFHELRGAMHIIGADNYHEANDAVRDILMMYVDMAHGYAGFGHNADVHVRFDPYKFVDAEVDDAERYCFVDIDLLRTGSAVAVLCAFYNVWLEEQELEQQPLTERFQAAVDEKRFSRFPDIEGVIAEAISRNSAPIEDPWIDQAVAPIYQRYVLGLFARLAQQDRSRVRS